MKPKAFLCLNVHSDQAPEEIFCSWDYYLNIKITNSSPPAFSEIQSQRWLMHCFPASHYSQQWWMHCPLALHYSHHNIMNSYNIGYHKSLFTPAWKLQYDIAVSCYGLSQSYGSEKWTVVLRRGLLKLCQWSERSWPHLANLGWLNLIPLVIPYQRSKTHTLVIL